MPSVSGVRDAVGDSESGRLAARRGMGGKATARTRGVAAEAVAEGAGVPGVEWARRCCECCTERPHNHQYTQITLSSKPKPKPGERQRRRGREQGRLRVMQ